ncbi:hypothetical protein AGMMS49938_01540 [Fibrobacterales bacterium]|nr:hypothetical protein AGMMS49938_01540 [Fibrobacterales bacterium]
MKLFSNTLFLQIKKYLINRLGGSLPLASWKSALTSAKALSLQKPILWLLVLLATPSFPQDTLPLFVPQKPAKPLSFCTAQKEYLALAETFPDWEEITHLRGVVVKMPYATYDNFSGHNLYCGIGRAFLHKDAAQKLKRAIGILKKQAPNYKFIIFDAARSNHAQSILKAAVRGTPYTHFVSNPVPAASDSAIKIGSLHAYGMAIDIGLLNENGDLADMGLPYDSFAFYAGKKGEQTALEQGLLNAEQIKNRELLRSVMGAAGWSNLSTEWWHFNAAPGDSIRTKYDLPRLPPQ